MSDVGSASLADVLAAYKGSDADLTKALFARLAVLDGPFGLVAINLYRSQKASERAKVYRGGRYVAAAYDKKDWALRELVESLEQLDASAEIAWGWGVDKQQPYHRQVLYIELPTGQVSFHTADRGRGPDHAKPWDGRPGQSADRIIRWIARLLDGRHVSPAPITPA